MAYCPICRKTFAEWLAALTHVEQAHAKSKKISKGRLAEAFAFGEDKILEEARDG